MSRDTARVSFTGFAGFAYILFSVVYLLLVSVNMVFVSYFMVFLFEIPIYRSRSSSTYISWELPGAHPASLTGDARRVYAFFGDEAFFGK